MCACPMGGSTISEAAGVAVAVITGEPITVVVEDSAGEVSCWVMLACSGEGAGVVAPS